MKKFPVLLVEWLDASSTDPWTDIADISGSVRCVSAGFVVHRSKDCISLASTIDPVGGQACTIIHIPVKMILKKRKLKI